MAYRNRGQSRGNAICTQTIKLYSRIRIRRSKNYAYRLITNEGKKSVCKVNGITLKYHASKLVNFEVMKSMIFGQVESVINVHTEHNIKRKRRVPEGV